MSISPQPTRTSPLWWQTASLLDPGSTKPLIYIDPDMALGRQHKHLHVSLRCCCGVYLPSLIWSALTESCRGKITRKTIRPLVKSLCCPCSSRWHCVQIICKQREICSWKTVLSASGKLAHVTEHCRSLSLLVHMVVDCVRCSYGCMLHIGHCRLMFEAAVLGFRKKERHRCQSEISAGHIVSTCVQSFHVFPLL